MTNLPAIELLEEMHRFPGPYMFKVIGHHESGFLARVVGAVREELAMDVDPHYHHRETQGNRYIAVTVQPVVRDGAQVLSIYRRLMALTGIVMLW